MIPARRVYFLLISGIAIAPILSLFITIPVSIAITLLFDAVSLELAGLHRGDRVGVGVFDRQMHTWIVPERSQSHLGRLIDYLTPITVQLVELYLRIKSQKPITIVPNY